MDGVIQGVFNVWRPEESPCPEEYCFIEDVLHWTRTNGGWLGGEPDDADCAEDGDEDRMAFVFNRGDHANSNGFVDADAEATHRALVIKPVTYGCGDEDHFERVWTREFRYDGARQRYLVRELNPDTLGVVADL